MLYSPDSFGHPAAFPALARGFDLPLVILSRGYGGARWPAGDTARWQGPDGEGVLLYALSRRGYDVGENLPVDEASVFGPSWKEMQRGSSPRPQPWWALRREALLARFPDYEERVARHVRAAESAPFCFAATAALFRRSGLLAILLVCHALGGGVRRHLDGLVARLAGRAKTPITAHCWVVAPNPATARVPVLCIRLDA